MQIEECVVCSDKQASVLFKPCGHMCACDGKICFLFLYFVVYTCVCDYVLVFGGFFCFTLWHIVITIGGYSFLRGYFLLLF